VLYTSPTLPHHQKGLVFIRSEGKGHTFESCRVRHLSLSSWRSAALQLMSVLGPIP
jgi:hypothetical protein